jgi:hypothetical protein
MYIYEVRPRKAHRGFDLISDALPFGRLWYAEPNAVSNAIGYGMQRSRSADAVIFHGPFEQRKKAVIPMTDDRPKHSQVNPLHQKLS